MAPPARSPRAPGRRPVPVVRTLLAAAVGLVMLLPLYWMVLTAFSPLTDLYSTGPHWWPSAPTLHNFRTVLALPTGTWLMNSVVVTLCVVALTVTVNLLAGYAFAKTRFRGRSTLFLVLVGTMTVPLQVLMVPQFKMVGGLGLFGTFWAVILPASSATFGIFLSRQFMLAIPDEVIEAARCDGAGQFRTFVSVVLPLSKPLIAVLSLLTFLNQWNDFAWPLTVLKDHDLYTLSVGLLFLQGQYTSDYGAIMALALISVLPMVVIFLCFQRYFVQGFARSGIK
ncbi:carbohydrate ABC transporter permease [Kitasatospora sp. NA04385]|uniref:carbohydrate ABC transporter permease n=1 Tax=Kitasatospora sp. NA04385 TaxID=2742135 RepID=UPI001591EF7D|nr:carbohydrate ABC transporter permease [Kitasatospora sp. NA04385]QKW17762.1 carbohydrate ABC transporter permease [Kitasatospora sp. NA04385]